MNYVRFRFRRFRLQNSSACITLKRLVSLPINCDFEGVVDGL